MNRKQGAAAGGAAFVTASLIAFWIQLEGVRFMPYRDQAGVWTVCSGHTGPDVIPGVPWSKSQCDEATRADLTRFGFVVIRCVQTPLARPQFEALVVMAGNIGQYAFCGSTLVRKLNDRDIAGAEKEFERWVFHGCSEVCTHNQGLLNRRQAELARFRQVPTQLASRGAATLQ